MYILISHILISNDYGYKKLAINNQDLKIF